MSLRLALAAFTAATFAAAAPAALAAPAPARTASEYQLIEAAYGGQLTRVRQLLAQGVAVDAQDEYGYTALMWAAQAGWPLTADVLLKRGATVDARDRQGRTALLLATVRKHPEVVRVLLGAGADPRAADKAGVTPLDYARAKGMAAITAMLNRAASATPAHPVAARTTPPHATPAPHGAPDPHPVAHATPKPVAPVPHATPHAPAHAPVAHATPHAPATPKPVAQPVAQPVAHATPHAPATPRPAVAANGQVALSAGFRAEIARLYGLYTEHLEMRNPESLNQPGFSQDLLDKLEQIFNALEYGSSASLPATKLHDARAWTIAARKQGMETRDDDRVSRQILDALEQKLADAGY